MCVWGGWGTEGGGSIWGAPSHRHTDIQVRAASPFVFWPVEEGAVDALVGHCAP